MLDELIDKITEIEKTALAQAQAVHLSLADKKTALINEVTSIQKNKLDTILNETEKKAASLYNSILKNANNEAEKLIENAQTRISKASSVIFNYLVN